MLGISTNTDSDFRPVQTYSDSDIVPKPFSIRVYQNQEIKQTVEILGTNPPSQANSQSRRPLSRSKYQWQTDCSLGT